MNKFALVIDGQVKSIFYTEKEASCFPDIAHLLVKIEDSQECDIYYFWDGSNFKSPVVEVVSPAPAPAPAPVPNPITPPTNGDTKPSNS